MELTNRMIEKYLKLSKKQKSQMITQQYDPTRNLDKGNCVVYN